MSGELRSDARWIFHIGHVGSTLVSRLLGELDGVLAIREPRLLRDLALSPPEVRQRYIAPVPKLMSRTFAADEIACVKATSFASEIAPQLVPPGERALFMYATPRNYIASILAGENSLQELRMLAGPRAQRANARDVYIAGPERCRSRRCRLGDGDDRAGSRSRGDDGPAGRLGRLRQDAPRHGNRARADCRLLRLHGRCGSRARPRDRAADEPLFEGARA